MRGNAKGNLNTKKDLLLLLSVQFPVKKRQAVKYKLLLCVCLDRKRLDDEIHSENNSENHSWRPTDKRTLGYHLLFLYRELFSKEVLQ